MAIDGIFLHFMKKEISEFAIGAKVDKVAMPSRYELVLTFRTRTENRRLFISVGGNSPRVNFTASNPENPQNPPMLCMYFRKLLGGAVLTNVRQQGMDRTLFFDFNATDEIGDRIPLTLVVEIMAQYSNCILLNGDGVILDAMKRVDSSKSSFREILPQRPYALPPQQDKISLETDSPGAALERILSFPEKQLSSAILSSVSGASPQTAKELAYRVTLGDCPTAALNGAQKDRLRSELSELADAIRTGAADPSYLADDNGVFTAFSFMPLTMFGGAGKLIHAPSLSAMLDRIYVEREKLLRARAKAEDLYRTVDQLLERTAKKIEAQKAELLTGEEMEEKRRFAELINANVYALKKGESFYEVPDYYQDYQPVRIPVQPDLSPAMNAQKYFKEYRKAQTAKKILSQQIENGAADLAYLQTVRDALSRAETQGELSEIRAELSEGGFLKRKTGTKNKKVSSVPPHTFTLENGAVVYVGRNNIQNDFLTFRKAQKNDYWFHVKKAPGSHVILSVGDRTPTEAEMEAAAQIAAWFSSQRERGMAEVDYTQVRNLKKPPAARPGFVIYHVYRTAYVKAQKPE